MHNVKKFAMGLGATALSLVVIFFIVSKFAPDSVKNFFKVS